MLPRAFAAHNFKTYLMKARVKSEMYMDENKLKVSAIHLNPLDYKAEGQRLLDEIRYYQNPQMQMANLGL